MPRPLEREIAPTWKRRYHACSNRQCRRVALPGDPTTLRGTVERLEKNMRNEKQKSLDKKFWRNSGLVDGNCMGVLEY